MQRFVEMRFYLVIFLLGFLSRAEAAAGNCAHYSFSVGDIKATVVSDGLGFFSASGSFPDAHPEAMKLALETNFMSDNIGLYYNPLHLDMGDRKVMIDVGSADKFGPDAGKLLESMAEAGLDPNAVTDVLLTHAHVDHIGGLLKPDGSLAFPNAKVYVSRVEFEFWKTAKPEDLQAEFTPEIRQLIVQVPEVAFDAVSERLELFELNTEVIPGITSRGAGGHTPGMTTFIIRNGEHSLMALGDALVWDAFNIQHPEWRMIFDIDGQAGIAARFSILKELADTGMMFLSYHDNFPGLGHIFRQGSGYGLRHAKYQF